MKNKVLFKLGAVVLAVAMLAVCSSMVSFAAEEPKITAQAASVELSGSAKTVQVPIVLSNNPGFVSALFKVSCNSTYFKLTKVTVGSNYSSLSLESQDITSSTPAANPYTISLSGDTLSSNITANGTLVTLTYSVAANTPAGEYDITVTTNSQDCFVNYNMTNFNVTPVSCKVTTSIAISFPDVPAGDWVYEAVKYATSKGYFKGYSNGKFGPADNIQRQDFVVVLANMSKVDLSQYSGRTKFSDVGAGSYYEAAVKWAYSAGVSSGYANGKFGVGDPITREQIVTMLYNFSKNFYKNTCSYNASKRDAYSDVKTVSSWAMDGVGWAIDKGVISGMTKTTIGPVGNASRAQVAQIFKNIDTKNAFELK